MSTLSDINRQVTAMNTITELSGVFEGIASLRIAQTKSQVLSSQAFFEELWQIYSQLRVGGVFRFGRGQQTENIIGKELLIAVTAEGGLSGDIDEKLINWLLKNHDPKKQDIVVIGRHGALKLGQAGAQFKKYFKLPLGDQNINVSPLIEEVQRYQTTTVYYQTYVSLMVQDIKRIELGKAVAERGNRAEETSQIISEETYIFEPSAYAVASHLERSMLQITLSQVILESKLAQYASRFRAMSASHERAEDQLASLNLIFQRSRRALKDERLKEIINGLRKTERL